MLQHMRWNFHAMMLAEKVLSFLYNFLYESVSRSFYDYSNKLSKHKKFPPLLEALIRISRYIKKFNVQGLMRWICSREFPPSYPLSSEMSPISEFIPYLQAIILVLPNSLTVLSSATVNQSTNIFFHVFSPKFINKSIKSNW